MRVVRYPYSVTKQIRIWDLFGDAVAYVMSVASFVILKL
jgi:hypothetical protein